MSGPRKRITGIFFHHGGPLQLSLFDQQDLAEITHPDYPGERLIAWRNPLLADQRAREREDLLSAIETLLSAVAAQVAAGRIKGRDKIGVRAGRVVNKHKMAKHLILDIGENYLTFRRDQAAIDAEAALDGICVIRTPLPAPVQRRAFELIGSPVPLTLGLK